MGITFAGAQDVETGIPCDAAAGAETEQSQEAIKAEQEPQSPQESSPPDESGKEVEATTADQSQEPQLVDVQKSTEALECKPPESEGQSQGSTTNQNSPSDEASEKVRLKRIAAQDRWDKACDRKAAHVGSLALDVAKAKSCLKATQEAFNEEVEELQELYDRGYYPFMENDDVGDGEAQGASGEVSDLRDGADAAIHAGGVGDSVHHAGGVDQSAASEAAATRWEDRPVIELIAYGAPKSTIEKLADDGHNTIERFERLRADISLGREKWPKGIGEAKITKLEDAIVAWGKVNYPKGGDSQAESERTFGLVPASSMVASSQSFDSDAPAANSAVEASKHAEQPVDSIGPQRASPASVERVQAESRRAANDVEQAEESSAPEPPPESNAEPSAKPKRSRKKKAEDVAPDGEQAPNNQTSPKASPVLLNVMESLVIDGTVIPAISVWEAADNRDRVTWLGLRGQTLLSMHAAGTFKPEHPAENVKGRMAATRGDAVSVACIMQPGTKLDSWLFGFYSATQSATDKATSVKSVEPAASLAFDADLADL